MAPRLCVPRARWRVCSHNACATSAGEPSRSVEIPYWFCCLPILHDEADCFALTISTLALSKPDRIMMVGTPTSRGQETLAVQLNPVPLEVTAKVAFMAPAS